MAFEFDEAESETNAAKHGIDFVAAQTLWLDERLIEIPAKTVDEPRSLVIGAIGGRHYSAVITYLEGRVRIISVRRSRSMTSGASASGSKTAMPMRLSSAITTRGGEMSIPNDTPIKRRPTHPGEILREDFMPDYGLTVSGLADLLGVSRQTVNELLRERRSLSPEMALRLSALFGSSPEFWLNLQRAVDLWDARTAVNDEIRRIKPLCVV